MKAEKEKQEEENQRLLKELELQKENFENEIKASQKQLNNQKKFIETQTQERENEIDEYLADLDKLKTKLNDKESKELNYLDRIRQYEEQIEQINEEKQQLDKCYQETSTRLANENRKNKQLQNLLEEYEKTKEKTEQVEKELRERLTKLEEDLYSQLKLNETLKKNQTEQSSAIINSFVDSISENVEKLRCSSANHESNVLKTMSYFDQHSNNVIHETLQDRHDKSDSLYNSSSIDCTFPDAKKLEEKNLKLNSLVENVVRENQDLNDELKEAKNLNQNLESRICKLETEIDALKKNLEKMRLEKRVLEASMNEKQDKLNELQMQLEERMNDDNESTLKQSIESLKRRLHDEEWKVNSLDEELRKTNSKLTEKQNQIYRISNEMDRVKTEKHKIENERSALQQRNKRLYDERVRLQQEIEDLQNEREDDMEDNCDIKKMFETVLQDKDEEIAHLNGQLDEINQKLKDCLSISPVDRKKTSSFTLLDQLISFYKKSDQPNQQTNHAFNNLNNGLNSNQFNMNGQRSNHPKNNKPASESYDSLSPIESCEDQLTSDELNDDDDDDICSKLAGIHNNSMEICNLSFHFKNEKGLIKLINEIPEIVTNEKLTKKEINDWEANFIDCFSNKTIAQLLTKNIISIRPTYMNSNNSQELIKQLEICKGKLRSEALQLRKCNGYRKALIFQKKYLMNLNRQLDQANKQSYRQTFRRQSSNHQKPVNKFKAVAFFHIASYRFMKMKKQQSNLIEHCEQEKDLINKIDKLNHLTGQLTNVLNPTAEKYSSFLNSLNPSSSSTKVPFNHQSSAKHPPINHQLTNNQPNKPHHLSLNNHQTRAATIKNLEDLLVSLKEVYDRLVFDDTLISSSSSSLSD